MQAPAHLSIYDAADSNRRRTILLVAIFIVFIAVLGYALGDLWSGNTTGGLVVLPFAFGVSAVSALASYYAGDKVVLAVSHARPVTEKEEPVLHNVAEALAIGDGLPKPALYLIEDTAPNAFATGRDPQHASIVVTRGLLQKMDRTELEGVLAHEMSHVKNLDTRLMLEVAVLLGMVALLADWILRTMWWGGGRRDRRDRGGAGGILIIIGLVLAILAPIIAQLMQLAVSRQREYLADASGALLTRYPAGLANALRKIAADPEPLEVANKATAPLYIANPLHDAPRAFDNLFNTHPPIEERIRRLEAMG
ncbi:MAG: zinc metalloprotease HtpX [Chloroflexi bacterium]|nr:MAG: zinc metalloprotease HtpX [Chloroflexota bacterium]